MPPTSIDPRSNGAWHCFDRGPISEAPPIPCLSVAPGRVHLYEMPAHWYGGRTGGGGVRGLFPVKVDNERAAWRSRQNALEAAGWLWLSSRFRYVDLPRGKVVPFRMAMWTLTIPEPMPEIAARRALSSWWTWARNVSGVRSYLWVAELTKRGRVHFHALVNDWVDVDAARGAWLRALQREGCAVGLRKAPGKLVRVDNVTTAKSANGYVSKYIGKDFGTRADQLAHRYARMGKEDGAPFDARAELRARVFEAVAWPLKLRRRWGASNNLERSPLQVVGCDDPGMFKALVSELRTLPGARWGEMREHGQGVYFDLDAVKQDTAPRLWRMLRDGAAVSA